MLTALNPYNQNQPFPPLCEALEEPNGLLAVGGCLSARRLLNAYRQGIFPWYSEGEPILWWSPQPRLVITPEQFKASRSLRKILRNGCFQYSFDRCFPEVMDACAEPRSQATGTWISPAIKTAFCRLYALGYAHSFEAWQDGVLVGGLYGLAMGQVFFGESMFHRSSNASKAAFAFGLDCLKNWGYQLVDCQVYSDHLASLGAFEISREQFIEQLNQYCEQAPAIDAWNSRVEFK